MKKWKKLIIFALSISMLGICGCDNDDDDDDSSTTATTASSDVNDVKALTWTASGDPHNLVGLYGTLESFADLPVNFNIAAWSAEGVHVTIPEGEDNLDPLGQEHMQKRRVLILAFNNGSLYQLEDFAYTYNAHIGLSFGAATHLLAIHCKNGSAVSRTKLTDVNDI